MIFERPADQRCHKGWCADICIRGITTKQYPVFIYFVWYMSYMSYIGQVIIAASKKKIHYNASWNILYL